MGLAPVYHGTRFVSLAGEPLDGGLSGMKKKEEEKRKQLEKLQVFEHFETELTLAFSDL